NLVTNVRHKNRHIVAVVLGGRTGAQRDHHMRELIADNLDDATAGPRTAPLIAEAPAPRPQRVAKAQPTPQPQAKNDTKTKNRRTARTPKAKAKDEAKEQPKPQPIVVAGSNEPIRPIPVKTMLLDAD